jgi:predicted ribosome quality control (RQC) complex YloA/Tae2 family protein
MPEKTRTPFKTVTFQGFEILIGRSDAENDQLTFEVAESDDLWLHVDDFPGSHVVVRKRPEITKVPTEVLRRAAELAAWHSKAKNLGKVNVHYCLISEIRKENNHPAGTVEISNYKEIKVTPAGPKETEMTL